MHIQVDGFELIVVELGNGQLEITSSPRRIETLLTRPSHDKIEVVVRKSDMHILVDDEQALRKKRELRLVLDLLEDAFKKIEAVDQEAKGKVKDLIMVFSGFLNN